LLKYEEGIDIPIRSEKMTKLNSVILYKSADTNVSLIEKRTLEKIQTLEEDILSM
jgi:transcriptional regulator